MKIKNILNYEFYEVKVITFLHPTHQTTKIIFYNKLMKREKKVEARGPITKYP